MDPALDTRLQSVKKEKTGSSALFSKNVSLRSELKKRLAKNTVLREKVAPDDPDSVLINDLVAFAADQIETEVGAQLFTVFREKRKRDDELTKTRNMQKYKRQYKYVQKKKQKLQEEAAMMQQQGQLGVMQMHQMAPPPGPLNVGGVPGVVNQGMPPGVRLQNGPPQRRV
mmetsp:Transcript_316/g.773  ORF Transcript_316/g.773 Transcript_316/m.773 type:complete len:170 (+) Transcript_316:137-646(+)